VALPDNGGPLPTDRETSIRRGIEVLLSLATDEAVQQGGMGVTRIAEQLGREKSQVSRALKALAEYGLVERNRDALTYRLGWRIYALAQLAGQPRVLEEARPRLRQLVASVEERAYLTVLQGVGVLTLLSESPGRAVEAVGWVGRTTPAYCTSSGHALLLDHDRQALELFFSGVELTPRAPKTPTNLDAIAERLERARRAGYVISDEEFEQGLISVAAPVRDAGGAIVAALNVSGPKFRFGRRVRDAAEAVLATALDLSSALAPADEPVAADAASS
jgi:IclR family transcriptional regulator, KDG regulon repressor